MWGAVCDHAALCLWRSSVSCCSSLQLLKHHHNLETQFHCWVEASEVNRCAIQLLNILVSALQTTASCSVNIIPASPASCILSRNVLHISETSNTSLSVVACTDIPDVWPLCVLIPLLWLAPDQARQYPALLAYHWNIWQQSEEERLPCVNPWYWLVPCRSQTCIK